MDAFLSFISDYGMLSYGLLFAYCALKSGALPLFAGIAAHYGALDLYIVAITVFLGGYLGDEIRFYLVRRFGISFADKRPKLANALNTAKLLLERYGRAYVFIYRYPKGMRTVGALPVALTSITWRNFTVLNALSALTWTLLMVGAGFIFGEALEYTVGENWGVLTVALLLIFLIVSYIAWLKLTKQVLAKESS